MADHDLWIAAHALVHEATLVTNNDRGFGRYGIAARKLDEGELWGLSWGLSVELGVIG